MPRILPQKSNAARRAALVALPLRSSTMPLMSNAICSPLAGYANASGLVGGARVGVDGLQSKTTDFNGPPRKSDLALVSKLGFRSSHTESAVNALK
eukprot:7600155-Pyramimonas_sp.AAC.1